MNILLIQILRLGDALQMTPIIKGLKQTFPDANIHVLTSVIGKQIFERQTEVDEVFVLHKQELASLCQNPETDELLSAIALLKSDLSPVFDKKWDWVINFSFSFPSAILAFIAHGAYCSGFYATKNRQYISKEKWFAYAVSSFVNRKYSIFNWVDINKKIIGLRGTPDKPVFVLEAEEIQEAKNHLEQTRFAGKPIIGIHPGASGNHKRWPLENFIKLGRLLIDKHNYGIVVFGDKGETKLGKTITENLYPDALDLTGRTTLSQLAAYISLCSFFVCNDSGPMHIASAVGVPIITLFFSTHFIETGPYGENNIVIHPEIPCFPCQGTASCVTKECLKYIKPHTVEKIIISRNGLIENSKRFNPDENDGQVSIKISGFDPWGNLEWIPVGNPPIQFDDILRLIFKVSWLSSLDTIEDKEGIDKYIKGVLKSFSNHMGNVNITHNLQLFKRDIERLMEAFNQGYGLCFKIQSALVEPNVDVDRIQRIGSELQKQEGEIVFLGKNPLLSPFVEYFRLSLENIIEKEIFRLSTKTLNVYKEMMVMADTLKSMSSKIFSQFENLKTDEKQ